MTRPMMTGKEMRIAAIGALGLAAVTLAAGVAAAGGAVGNPTGGAPFNCEIRQSLSGSQILLQPTVTASSAASGSYSLTLVGGGAGGSASVRQGGDFTASPGQTTSLGQVSVDGRGAAYRARLEVTMGGRSTVCTSKVGSAFEAGPSPAG